MYSKRQFKSLDLGIRWSLFSQNSTRKKPQTNLKIIAEICILCRDLFN